MVALIAIVCKLSQGYELASRATLGAVLRTYNGAAVSFADMISDAIIIIQYFGEGRDSYVLAPRHGGR